MKNKILLLTLLLIAPLLIHSVYAYGPVGENGITVKVVNGSLDIVGYTVVQNLGVTSQVKSNNLWIPENSNSTNWVCNSVTVPEIVNGTYTGSNSTVSPVCGEEFTADIPFLNQSITQQNQSTLYCISQDQYNQCIQDKSQYSASLTGCLKEVSDAGNYQTNFTTCSTQLTSVNSQLTTAQASVTSLQKQIDDSKNNPVIYGAIALIVGVGGTYYFTNKNSKYKQPDDSYNRRQAV